MIYPAPQKIYSLYSLQLLLPFPVLPFGRKNAVIF